MQRELSIEALTGGTPCGICGNPAESRRELNDGYFASCCHQCDFLTTDIEHDPDRLDEVNRANYDVRNRIEIHSLRYGELTDRYERILKWIRRNSPVQIHTLLEIGSNIGEFAAHVAGKGILVESVEINDNLRTLQTLLHGIPAYKSLSEITPGRKFDGIVLMDVLEHIPEPVKYLDRLRDFLTDGGIVFLQMPNKNSWISRITGKRWGWWSAPDHLYHFSGRAIFRAAEKAGFQVIRLRYVSPVLDDLEGIPVVGRILSPARFLSRWINPNRLVEFQGGSLIQAILRAR